MTLNTIPRIYATLGGSPKKLSLIIFITVRIIAQIKTSNTSGIETPTIPPITPNRPFDTESGEGTKGTHAGITGGDIIHDMNSNRPPMKVQKKKP